MQQRSFQLNPFVFPAETRTRLKLLIIAVCLLSIQIGFVLADRLGLPSPSRIGSLVAAASAMPSPGTAELPGGELIYRAFLGTNIGLLGQLLLVLALPLLLCGLMLALAWLLYLLHPRFIAAGALAAASTEDGSAQLQHAVEDLSGKVALRLAPRVQLTEGRRDGNMRIFGFPGRYQLRIGGGWRIERLARPERFRAVLLHELAHVMNGDIAVAYFSRALALSFLVVVVAPTLAVVGLSALLQASRLGVNPTALLEFAIALIQGAATLAVLAALRASLLRVRELYADWRVVLWGEGEPLRILLAEQAATQGRRSWWRQAWSFHPTLAERSQTIQQPARLFTVAHDLAFFVGFLFALLIASLPTLLQLLGVILLTVIQIWQVAALADPNEASLLVRSAAFAIPLLVLALVVALAAIVGAVGFLLTETLGLDVQRAAVADLAVVPRRPTAVRMLGVALFTALGITAGLLLVPFNFLTIGRPTTLLLMPIWTATLVPLLWLWCMGVYKAGQTVLGSHIGHTAPRLKRRLLGLVLFVLACAAWLLPVLTQQVALPLVGLAGAPSLVTAVFVIFSGVGLALVCFVALSALLWLVIALWLMVRPIQCPYCGQRQGRKPTVGQLCGRCGCSLAAWVYFDDGQGHHRALEAPGQ